MNAMLELHRAGVTLIPDAPTHETANYACTWNTQGRFCGGTVTIRDVLMDENLFAPGKGWAYEFPESVRKDLILLLDDGWDLPLSENGEDNRDYYGSFVLDPIKFPGYGETEVERLKTLSDKIRAAGWRGMGVWVCCQEDAFHTSADGHYDESYWIEKILWSKEAGILYWKNDWGNYAYTESWRRFISETANRLYPELIIEHITGDYGTNDPLGSGTCEGKIANMCRCASYSDVFRSYDVTTQLSAATTMDRVARLLNGAYLEEGDHMGLLNCEDELYLAAALGLSAGIMRSRSFGKGDLDEATRMVNWHRIAPPFEITAYPNHISDLTLTDEWHFTDDTWDTTIQNRMVPQHAAAAVSRGTALPVAFGPKIPFLAASRNPTTGALSIATLRRTVGGTSNSLVYAGVKWDVGPLTGPIGIFGVYKTLTLTFDRDISGLPILAQDLMGETAFDITDLVSVQGNELVLDGILLHDIGVAAATALDPSEPGLILQIGRHDDWAAPAPAQSRTN